jgi:hypothetical protein
MPENFAYALRHEVTFSNDSTTFHHLRSIESESFSSPSTFLFNSSDDEAGKRNFLCFIMLRPPAIFLLLTFRPPLNGDVIDD